MEEKYANLAHVKNALDGGLEWLRTVALLGGLERRLRVA